MSTANTRVSTELPIPGFFDPDRVGKVWPVPYEERAAQAGKWAETHGLLAAATDKAKVHLVIVDAQNTFCTPGFELVVKGAVEDNTRLCQFIYRNLDLITRIAPTMDTHLVMQIFHPMFWVNDTGEHPSAMTVISLDDVQNSVWKVNPAVTRDVGSDSYPTLQAYALYYVQKLTKDGKYPLMIWPYHAMLGGIGHALVSAVEEACFFHDIARKSKTDFHIKGGNPLTENYSVLRPEVLQGPHREVIAQINTVFVQTLLEADAVIIAGQAKSHCVAWTIADLLEQIAAKDPALARKVYLLEDCTSPVVIPGIIDFTKQANEAFQRFADAGMHVVRSTEPLESWPNFPIKRS